MGIEEIKTHMSGLGVLIEIAGVGIIVLGALYSSIRFFYALYRQRPKAYEDLRRKLGRSILLGLEFLVAGDIINTVSVTPTLKSVMTLGLVVLIRTFLSFSINIELERKLPWRGGGGDGV